MKKLTLLPILLFALSVSAQKKDRLFLIQSKYVASDGCPHTSYMEMTMYGNSDISYDFIYKNIVKWVKPYKIRKGTFEVISMKETKNKKRWYGRSEKFKPCCKPLKIDSGIRVLETSPILYISPGNSWDVDSTKTYTVRFARSKVTFINDSTFTFKLK